MRILLCTNSRDRGSTSRTLEAWCQLLPKEGVETAVTVGGNGPLLDALREAGVSASVRRLGVSPSRAWPFPFAAAVLGLYSTVRTSGASLIHVNEHDNHLIAAYAGALARVPVFTHMRFRIGPEYATWLFGRRPPDRLFFTSATQMHDCADAVRPVVSEARWRVLPNGLDPEKFGRAVEQRAVLRSEWGVTPETVVLGTACAISSRKRLDHFVRVVARLRGADVDARGFIAGQPYFPEDEKVLEELRALVSTLELGDAIQFLGYVEPSEPLYHAWDVCISTSVYESFGMSVLEAMACGCPVVTYPGGAVAEIVGEKAILVADGDEEALFGACLQLAHDPDARRKMGEEGRLRVADAYDIRRAVHRLADEYKHPR